MKYLIRKIYFILIILLSFFISSTSFSKTEINKYSQDKTSNYLSGIVSIDQNYTKKAFDYLSKVKSLKNSHHNYNIKFLHTLVLLEKFDEAFSFSKSIWDEKHNTFEVDLLQGINFFINKDYINAEKYFARLNNITPGNIFFEDFIGSVLTSWARAANNDKQGSFDSINKLPKAYRHLKEIQISLLKCYFSSNDAQLSLENLVKNENYNFSRYNFFLINYLLQKNKYSNAKEVIKKSRKRYSSNLLLKQTEAFLINDQNHKIKNFFNFKNPNDALAEFFYIIANLYSSQEEFQISNFYLKISLFLNKKFKSNKALLAENFYYLEREKISKDIYSSIKSIGSVYSWHASRNIASILVKEKDKKYAIKSLKKNFNLLVNPNVEHYYDLANFYKQNEYFEESIKYFSLALEKIEKDHFLAPKIFDRRGTSYEKIGKWENAEKDLLTSLEILPDQAHVLNYLGYSWIDKGINLDKGLEMLKKANNLAENDGYITDSVGWAYYVRKNYIEAEPFLQKAVELLPMDPIINDHYADNLWMLNKKIQARNAWKGVLKLDRTEKELKDSVIKKLIFGISKKL